MAVIDRLEQGMEAETGLPWHYDKEDGLVLDAKDEEMLSTPDDGEESDERGEFIAIAVNVLPDLLKIAAAAQSMAQAREGCVVCGEWPPLHENGCPIKRLPALGLMAVKVTHVQALRAALEPLFREEAGCGD